MKLQKDKKIVNIYYKQLLLLSNLLQTITKIQKYSNQELKFFFFLRNI